MAGIQHNGLYLTLPTGWEDGTQVVALGPVDGSFRPNLVASQEPTKGLESAERFALRQLPALKQALQGFTLVKEGPATFGRQTGFLREHHFMTRGAKLGQLQFYVVDGRTAFTFTFTHLSNKLVTSRKLAEQLFSQAQIRQPNL
jgi:hypothetical protein